MGESSSCVGNMSGVMWKKNDIWTNECIDQGQDKKRVKKKKKEKKVEVSCRPWQKSISSLFSSFKGHGAKERQYWMSKAMILFLQQHQIRGIMLPPGTKVLILWVLSRDKAFSTQMQPTSFKSSVQKKIHHYMLYDRRKKMETNYLSQKKLKLCTHKHLCTD